MSEFINSWKNKSIFEQQLALNLKELKRPYPSHWDVFITFMNSIKDRVKTILDIGCGCGAYSELCKRHFPNIKYTGMDYASEAVEIATKQWPGIEFIQKDYKDLTQKDIQGIDVLHVCGLLDILPNGDECLDFLLGLGFKHIILEKVQLTNQKSFYTICSAYDNNIQTYNYRHNYANIQGMILKHEYKTNETRDHNCSHLLLEKGLI